MGLRFDFTFPRALTDVEVDAVEAHVRSAISKDLPVHTFETSLETARQMGALFMAGEDYEETVRCVEVGAQQGLAPSPAWSLEMCGGTHVARTGALLTFAVVRECAVAAGVRRIEARCHLAAVCWLEGQAELVKRIGATLHSPSPAKLLETAARLREDLAKAVRRVDDYTAMFASERAELHVIAKYGSGTIWLHRLSGGADLPLLRKRGEWLAVHVPIVLHVLVAKDGPIVLATAKESAHHAGQVLRSLFAAMAAKIDGVGEGGGSKHFAQGRVSQTSNAPDSVMRALAVMYKAD